MAIGDLLRLLPNPLARKMAGLCAFDRPGDYDYFRITAGPLTLADRYRDRAPSKSRIERPMSGYRSLS